MTTIKGMFLKTIFPLAKIYWFFSRPYHEASRVVVTHEEKFLMIRHTYSGYYWTFPGGRLKKNELPSDGAIREVKEEVGIILGKVIPTGQFSFNSDFKTGVMYTFWAPVDSLEFKIDGVELAEARWFTKDNLPKEFGKNAQQVYKNYIAYGKS